MPFIQYINVPFVTAINIFPNVDSSSLNLSLSGSYVVIPSANDNFDLYPTGFRTMFSGSGFWLASGSTELFRFVLYDTMLSYPGTGFVSGAALTGNISVASYLNLTGTQSGYLSMVGHTYLYDTFLRYPTGLLSGDPTATNNTGLALTGNVAYSAFSYAAPLYGSLTGYLFHTG